MAKAINWPKEFYDEIMEEKMLEPRIALRLGTIYYDNGYYFNKETVDIRVDHKVVMKGRIIDEMRVLKIKDLNDEILSFYKKNMRTKEDVIKFLSKNYNQQVNEETPVTVIIYQNLCPARVEDDDPHM